MHGWAEGSGGGVSRFREKLRAGPREHRERSRCQGAKGVGLRHKLEVRPHFANEEGTYVSFEYVERKRP